MIDDPPPTTPPPGGQPQALTDDELDGVIATLAVNCVLGEEDAARLLATLDEARARAALLEALGREQQKLNEAMVASLQRGLEKLEASEAECVRLRDDCAALLKILDATYDGPLGRFMRDRIGEEIDAADRGRAPADQTWREGTDDEHADVD